MAKAAYHTPDNVEILDMHRGADTSSVRFPEGGCTQLPKPNPQVITLMRYFAKQEVKADLKAKGVPPQWVEARTISLLRDVFIQEHWAELETKAQRVVTKLRTNAQKQKQPNSKTSTVQNSSPKVEP